MERLGHQKQKQWRPTEELVQPLLCRSVGVGVGGLPQAVCSAGCDGRRRDQCPWSALVCHLFKNGPIGNSVGGVGVRLLPANSKSSWPIDSKQLERLQAYNGIKEIKVQGDEIKQTLASLFKFVLADLGGREKREEEKRSASPSTYTPHSTQDHLHSARWDDAYVTATLAGCCHEIQGPRGQLILASLAVCCSEIYGSIEGSL